MALACFEVCQVKASGGSGTASALPPAVQRAQLVHSQRALAIGSLERTEPSQHTAGRRRKCGGTLPWFAAGVAPSVGTGLHYTRSECSHSKKSKKRETVPRGLRHATMSLVRIRRNNFGSGSCLHNRHQRQAKFARRRRVGKCEEGGRSPRPSRRWAGSEGTHIFQASSYKHCMRLLSHPKGKGGEGVTRLSTLKPPLFLPISAYSHHSQKIT